MSISAQVTKRIEKMDMGVIISYRDFDDLKNQGAVALALSRLCKKGIIKRLQKGKYFKPKKTKFGELDPNDAQVMKGVLGQKEYVSGIAAFNSLGLTTQVPNEITIKGKKYPRDARVGKLKVRYKQSSSQNYNSKDQLLLQILDALENIKKIPGADVNEVFKKIFNIVKKLNPAEQEALAKLALKHKPMVRALIGATLENSVDQKFIKKLKASLNPLTVYKIGLSKDSAANLIEWRIK